MIWGCNRIDSWFVCVYDTGIGLLNSRLINYLTKKNAKNIEIGTHEDIVAVLNNGLLVGEPVVAVA